MHTILLSASTSTSIPDLIAKNDRVSSVSTRGIFEIAQPEAVVISALLLHIIAAGATPFTFIEYIAYAPTLLPIAPGKTSTAPLTELPDNS